MNMAYPNATSFVDSTNDNADWPTEDAEGWNNDEGADAAADEQHEENNEDAEEDNHAMAVYCKYCQTWLNGPRQWEDHKIGKKRKKNYRKASRSSASDGNNDEESVPAPPPANTPPTPDPVPAKITPAWLWLESGKTEKALEVEAQKEGEAKKSSRAVRRRRAKKEKEDTEYQEMQKSVNAIPDECLEAGVLAH